MATRLFLSPRPGDYALRGCGSTVGPPNGTDPCGTTLIDIPPRPPRELADRKAQPLRCRPSDAPGACHRPGRTPRCGRSGQELPGEGGAPHVTRPGSALSVEPPVHRGFEYSCPSGPVGAVLASLALILSRPAARAADSVDFKYENYREADGRITVVTESSSVNQDVAASGLIHLTGTIDAVAGATPTGQPAAPGTQQVPLTEIHTRRKAWAGDYAEQIKTFNVDAAFAESRESDYVSWGWSVNTLTDFNEKNTTLRAGLAGDYDRVEVRFEPAYLPKHTHDAILGITQLLNPTTFVTVNVTLGRSTGYLSEPYKIVEKAIEILPNIYLREAFGENSPNARNRTSVFSSVNHSFAGTNGALEASYRLYSDSYGIVAHTLQLAWLQHLGKQWVLEPSLRFYTQSAARFYYYDLDSAPVMPVHIPAGLAPYYTSDFRLSAEDSMSYGLKAIWRVSDWMRLDASYEEYTLHGRDGVTPASAYPRAGISTLRVAIPLVN